MTNAATVWFDLTASHRWQRAPSGITRVEQECLRWALAHSPEAVSFCVYDEEAQLWYPMSHEAAAAILNRQYAPDGTLLPGSGTAWVPASGPVVFGHNDTYLCLSADQTPSRLAALYAARRRGLRVLGMVHDIIQILHPHFFWDQVDQSASRYFVDLAWVSHHLFCNSECTRRDLERFYEEVQAPRPSTSVIRLGDTLPKVVGEPSAQVQELCRQPFVLTVGSIEIRKNHEVLYRAVLDLLHRGITDFPRLVFAGMRGWRVDDLLLSLDVDPRVRDRIVILDHASDADLAALYQACLFTAFPSLYEGWGLPVAESLSYGKYCLASDAGAIPEIAPGLLQTLNPHDVRAWADAILFYSRHPQELESLEQRIAAEYSPTPWDVPAAAILQRTLAEARRGLG